MLIDYCMGVPQYFWFNKEQIYHVHKRCFCAKCWVNIVPSFSTLAQYCSKIGSASCVSCALSPCLATISDTSSTFRQRLYDFPRCLYIQYSLKLPRRNTMKLNTKEYDEWIKMNLNKIMDEEVSILLHFCRLIKLTIVK